MNKTFVATLAMSATLISSSALAIQRPLKLASDSRIEVVAYSPANVVPVHGTTFTTTQITFAKDEFIENVQNGDLGAWTASINKTSPYMLFVKPTTYNSNTNMTVVTDKHTYYFQLTSNAEGQTKQDDATYAIHFIYPEEEKAKAERDVLAHEQQQQAEISASKNPADYNWNYSFNGDRSIVPIHVFDDGKFTYFQLQPNQPVPAVFAVDNARGDESVVNYRQDGQYLVIQRTAPQFTLRVGKSQVASIFNNEQIEKIQRN